MDVVLPMILSQRRVPLLHVAQPTLTSPLLIHRSFHALWQETVHSSSSTSSFPFDFQSQTMFSIYLKTISSRVSPSRGMVPLYCTLRRPLSKYIPPDKVESLFELTRGNKFASINSPRAGARIQAELPIGRTSFQLYSVATPNGQKISILLEELGIGNYYVEESAD